MVSLFDFNNKTNLSRMSLWERGASEMVQLLSEDHPGGGGESFATNAGNTAETGITTGLPTDAARRLTGPWFPIQVRRPAVLRWRLRADSSWGIS